MEYVAELQNFSSSLTWYDVIKGQIYLTGQISVRAQSHKSADGDEKFCSWSTDEVQI